MTEENKRLNIGEELERASAALESANVLAEKRLYSNAVSRLYYPAYTFTRADCDEFRRQIGELSLRIRKHLKSQGYIQ